MSARGLVSAECGRAARGTRRGGFTLIELVLVVVIVSILAAFAIPNYQIVVVRARAADLLARIDVVNVAVQSYLSDTNAWPGEAAAGAVPPDLVSFLPENFSFSGEDFELDWENAGGLVGIGIVTDNEPLGNALLDVAGPGRWFVSGNRYVFILETG